MSMGYSIAMIAVAAVCTFFHSLGTFRPVWTETSSAPHRTFLGKRTASCHHCHFDYLLLKRRQSAEFSQRHPGIDLHCPGSGVAPLETEYSVKRGGRHHLLHDPHSNCVRLNIQLKKRAPCWEPAFVLANRFNTEILPAM